MVHDTALLLPKTVDNTYQGKKLALWILGVILVFKMAQSFSVLIGGAFVLKSADGIPLDTYPHDAAKTIVAIWALLGLSRLVMSALGALVLIRYRAMVPLLYGILLIEDIGKQLVPRLTPFVRIGAPVGPTVSLVLIALMLIGITLSLSRRDGNKNMKTRD